MISHDKCRRVDCLDGELQHLRHARRSAGRGIGRNIGYFGDDPYYVPLVGEGAFYRGYTGEGFVDIDARVVVPDYEIVICLVDIILMESTVILAECLIAVMVEIEHTSWAQAFQTFHYAEHRVGAMVKCITHMDEINASGFIFGGYCLKHPELYARHLRCVVLEDAVVEHCKRVDAVNSHFLTAISGAKRVAEGTSEVD